MPNPEAAAAFGDSTGQYPPARRPAPVAGRHLLQRTHRPRQRPRPQRGPFPDRPARQDDGDLHDQPAQRRPDAVLRGGGLPDRRRRRHGGRGGRRTRQRPGRRERRGVRPEHAQVVPPPGRPRGARPLRRAAREPRTRRSDPLRACPEQPLAPRDGDHPDDGLQRRQRLVHRPRRRLACVPLPRRRARPVHQRSHPRPGPGRRRHDLAPSRPGTTTAATS